jgi:aspartate racemase
LPPGPPVLIAEEQPQVPDAHLPPTWTGDPETHCYLIYTSGSTGAPKATIITHANLAAYVSSLWVTLGLTPADRYLHTASSGFSSAIRQQFLPLSHGATVILSSAKEIMDPIRLLRSVPDRGVTVIDLVPSYWSRLCAVIRQDRGSLGADIKNSELRLLLSASEPLTAAVADAIDQIRPGDARLVNMYGLTETSGIAATLEIRRGDRLSDPLPIGRPIPDVTVMVADELLAEVSMGATGEIVVVGHTVGAGYENDEERTAERFSVTRLPGGLVTRAFRTGDLGRRMPGGRIQFVGRRDKQVKIRGFRVEPAEIEAALARHPAVQEVAVLIHRDANGDNALRAFILPHRDQRPTRVDIVSFVRNSLPSYMIPASFHLLSLFPRTASGKVDAIALAQADVNSPSIRKYVPPVTEEEIALTEIWVDVLKLERVGLHDDFFDLGGHSLLGLDTLARLQERFGVTVQWSEVFLNPTVAELAGHVSRLRSGIGRVDALRSPAEPAST